MNEINKRVSDLIKYLESQYDDFDGSDITVKMNNRLTSTAGRANPASGIIELSTKLYEANKEAFHANTIPHEIAHIVACRVLGSRGHDAAWHSVMLTLGVEANRCHSYEVKKSGKIYLYKCDCMTHEFTPQRQAWAVKGKKYVCKHCRGALSFVGVK